jgi:hypothetical protein
VGAWAFAAPALLAAACASLAPVEAVDARRREALVAADVAALDALLADGARYVHANGEAHDKAALLALLASGALDYRAIEVEELALREVAGAAVLTGRQTVEVVSAGRLVVSRSFFSAVYTRSGGAWRLVAYQSTPLPPLTPAPAPPTAGAPRAP